MSLPFDIVRETWRELGQHGLAQPLHGLFERLHATETAYVVGGFPRDILRARLEGVTPCPKDVDVIVDTAYLEPALRQMGGRLLRTPLGGFRWTPCGSDLPVDIWQLKDTLWIREYSLPSTIDSFLAGVDLDIDRIVIGLYNGSVFGSDCQRALHARQVNADALWRVEALAYDEFARALMASQKLGYPLAKSLRARLALANNEALSMRAFERLGSDGYEEVEIASALRALVDVQGLISNDAFQAAILVFESAHFGDVTDFHAAELALPGVKCRRADAVSPADVFGRPARFVLFENADDLGFAEPRFLHDGLLRGRWPQNSPPISGLLFRPHVNMTMPLNQKIEVITGVERQRRYTVETEIAPDRGVEAAWYVGSDVWQQLARHVCAF